MILRAVDDMTEHCILESGYFYYKELPSLQRVGNNALVLEALAIAYELTGDKKYLEAGMRTFRTVVQNALESGHSSTKRVEENSVLIGNTGTKRFAQMMIPTVTFYKAAAESGLL